MEPIEHLDDPRLIPYRNLPDRAKDAPADCFIAEGEFLVRRLLASPFEVESVLATPAVAGRLAAGTDAAAVQILVAPPVLIRRVVGFPFHRGVLACAHRGRPPVLEDVLRERPGLRRIVVCCGIGNPNNIGAIIRATAAFGYEGVLLDSPCADPFSRQALRASMGSGLSLPIIQSADLPANLQRLRDQGFTLSAAVAGDDAVPLHGAPAAPRMTIIFGSEGHGLPANIVSMCDRRITIPMCSGVDSLNVAMACAIVLYHFSSPCD